MIEEELLLITIGFGASGGGGGGGGELNTSLEAVEVVVMV